MGKEYLRSYLKWFYYISTSLLCLTNIVFFIYHFFDWKIEINTPTSLLLTFIGFLFAFAGINIYSIFNTNIEFERKRLDDLYNSYKVDIECTMSSLKNARDLVRYYQLCQLMISSSRLNSQSLEIINSLNSNIDMYKQSLYSLYINGFTNDYKNIMQHFMELSRGMHQMLNDFSNKLKDEHFKKTFFEEASQTLQDQYKKGLNDLITTLRQLEDYDFTQPKDKQEVNDETHLSRCQKFRKVWNDLCDCFKS
jgi:hypothetical protein